MMTHAYSQLYLDKSSRTLGNMLTMQLLSLEWMELIF